MNEKDDEVGMGKRGKQAEMGGMKGRRGAKGWMKRMDGVQETKRV